MIAEGCVSLGVVVTSDWHSNMYRVIGGLGRWVVRTDAAAIWATGAHGGGFRRSIAVELEGKLSVRGHRQGRRRHTLRAVHPRRSLERSLEFVGPGVATLSMDARLSIANMTTEWGALAGVSPWTR